MAQMTLNQEALPSVSEEVGFLNNEQNTHMQPVSLQLLLDHSSHHRQYENDGSCSPTAGEPQIGNPKLFQRDFFQRAPPFLIQLQNILRKYPDGGQILKELIQNADDAKASEVIFVYDERGYGTETLYSKDLSSIQGPALLAYNNEMFTDRDWEGIQRPGNSIKRKDPDTVGRFGLGFNSVYHITDYPAIFSGKNIGILDPQEAVFHRGGLSWNLKENKQSIEQLVDQFKPFQKAMEVIGCGSWNEILDTGCFKGTLFRFPLRLTPSEISEDIYSSERVGELFESFIRDASISLLFLRHVSTVSLKRIGSDGKVIHLLTVSVITEKASEVKSDNIITGTHFKTTSVKGFSRKDEEYKWLVTTTSVHGNMFSDLLELSKKLCNKPVLDLAYPLSKKGIDSFGGRLSCVLPLPDKEENRTGLPVLINGCFDLTDDRRSMKWLEIDQQHDESAKWNHILVEKLLPLVYTCAVKDAVGLAKASKITAEDAYDIWPDPNKTVHKDRWHNLTKQMSLSLKCERVLQTADKSHWITTPEAVFLFNNDDHLLNCLEELLVLLKQPLVKIPKHVYRTLTLTENQFFRLNTVTPAFIRKILHKGEWIAFSKERKMQLLGYVLSDGQYKELLDLQLLPLSDGTFTSFQSTDHNGMVYIDSQHFPRILLPGLANRFLPEDLAIDILCHLQKIGLKRIFKNLVCLDQDVIRRKLHDALPLTWQSLPGQVTWRPRDPNNPPIGWLPAFWTFLQQYENLLDSFENQPLVPLKPITGECTVIQLARLKRNTTLLFQSTGGHSLTDNITKLLENVGCTVIRQGNPWLWHRNLLKYILEPTSNNVIKVFCQLNLKQIIQTFTNMHKESIMIICDFLSKAYSFSDLELKVMCQLPLFSTAHAIGSSDSRLVAAYYLSAVERNTFPAVPESLVFPQILIRCRNDSDQRLLQLMRISFLNAADLALLLAKAICDSSYKHYHHEAQNAMLWILRNGHTLFAQSAELTRICKSLDFIPCNGQLLKPSDMFDPTINIFKDLFEPEKFPPTAYTEDSVLKSLRTLGLKDSIDKITVDDVLQIAKNISQGRDHSLLMKRAKALIKVCNDTWVLSEFNTHDLKKLCSIAWVPNNSQTEFSEPNKLRNMSYSNIVEFSMPLTKDFNEKASTILGLNDHPPADKVVENINILYQKHRALNKSSVLKKLHSIYNYIQDNLNNFHGVLLKVMIWNGGGFSNPSEIVLSYPEGLDLSSIVKKLPEEFLNYKCLFIKCGVRNSLSETEVINILYTMKHNLDSRSSVNDNVKDLRLAISILEWMKANSVHGEDDLPIPVQVGRNVFSLKPLSTTLFCDMDKQHLNDISNNCTDCHIVHEEVSAATARYLNIQLLSTRVLKPELLEPWGQSEPVTLRIKNILREYSEQEEIFKELIQNADDAVATVCEFLVDMRQNSESRQHLIDPGMASCHGPALWSYNNSTFTEKDFLNITRIGAATKENQMKKIGKFGLGFNSVYHITDIPLIMSGKNVIIFDPNVSHIKKHIPNANNPGIKLNLQKNSEILQIFPDQFYPFSNVFDCKLKQPFDYDGTLIRLPFRTEQEAKDSHICQQAFGDEQIKRLMKSFERSSDTLLIFLKNLESISLSSLSKDLCPENRITCVNINKNIVQKLEIPQDIILQQEQKNASKLLGMHMNGLDITVSSIIQISVQQNVTRAEKFYLVQSSIGIKGSFQMFSQNKNTIFNLPVAGVALPLKWNPYTEKWSPDLLDFSGMVFCFLPLPGSTGLPFHLNGSFAVMSNRKSLWDTTEKGEWNKKLFGDAALVALLTALSQIQLLSQRGEIQDYCYYTFWPDFAKIKTQYTEAVKAFYHAVAFGFADYFPALFSNGQECCTIKHACFLQLDNIQDEQFQNLANKVFSSALNKPYLAVFLPEWVQKSFTASQCSSELLLNTYNCERFYRDIVFETLNSLDAAERNALILHAIDFQDKKLDNLLTSKPCIPSSSGGKLQFIKKLVHPEGKVAILFDHEEGCFPQGADFRNPNRLVRLQSLGMTKDTLPIKELMERTHRINDVWKYDRNKALKQICCVLELLEDMLYKFSDDSFQSIFRNIPFLPAMIQSNLGEKKDTLLMKSTDLYHYKYKDLVCLTKPVLSKEHVGKIFEISDKMSSFLGLDHLPSYETVLLQLQELQKTYNLLNTEACFQIVKKCYNYLNKLMYKEPNQVSNTRRQIPMLPFIYIGEEFVPLNCVARKVPFNASPYLYELPKEYEAFDKLWNSAGLRDEFSIHDYINVLANMSEKHKGSPLPANELTIVLHLISNITEKISCAVSDDLIDVQKIFVPDIQSVLRHIDNIYFNDTPWLPCNKELYFCHDMIPRAVVPKLGIKTMIHHTLQKLKISNLSNFVCEFGAKEELTTRLKNIIKEYSSKTDILKELVQNADDSGATEVHFVLDCRTHTTVKTFGSEWNLLQGPALCIYNNKTFDPKDIDGIQLLGKGGKSDRLDKTGKFGLGFNSVYHITDCPSFVTGDNVLCVFDPNLLFLESSNCESPGGKFHVNNEFKCMFKDVYDTFLHCQFNLQEGTLFRLPLRMAETVAMSKICNQTVSLEDIRSMGRELAENADSLTLFLNNIQKITFSEISDTGDVKQTLSIKTKIEDVYENMQTAFKDKLAQMAENETHMPETVPFRVFYKMEIKSSHSKKPRHWLIAKQLGIEGEDNLANLIRISNSLHQTVIPHGAIATCLNDSNEGKAFCTLPLPVETGLPVHISANFIVDSARRDICKEDGTSPKTEWNTFLLSNVIAPLYCYLLVLIRNDISKGKKEPLVFKGWHSCKLLLNRFLHVFPRVTESVPPEWQKLVGQVYWTIFKKQLKLIPVYRVQERKEKFGSTQMVHIEWSCVGQSSICEEPYFLTDEKYEKMGFVLHNINMKLVFGGSLHFICIEFKRAGVKIKELTPKTLCNFLREIPLHLQGNTLPMPVCETFLREEKSCKILLQYCLSGYNAKNNIDLQGVPLLVTVDGMLRYFNRNEPSYYSEFCELFPDDSMKFAKFTKCQGLCTELAAFGFLQYLSIKDAAVLIKKHLGPTYQISNIKCYPTLSQNNKEWLKNLWSLFESELKKTENKEMCKEQFKEITTLFHDWAILPVFYNKLPDETILFPLGKLKNVLDHCLSEVSKCLFKLGFPKLDTLIPLTMKIDHMQNYMLNTEDCCSLLENMYSKNDLLWETIDDIEIGMLATFFLKGLKNMGNKKNFAYQLQSLPLFETYKGNRQRIHTYQKKYILEHVCCLVSKTFYELDSQIIFLKCNSFNKELTKYVDMSIINEIDFLAECIISHMASFSDRETEQILHFLLTVTDFHEYKEKRERIVTALKPMRLIRNKQGELQQPSYFYDHNVDLFTSFGLQSMFILDELIKKFENKKKDFCKLLRDLGMHHKVSEEDFIKFATMIETESKGQLSEDLSLKVKKLFNYLLSMDEKEITCSFITNIQSIKFLIPLKVSDRLKSLYPSFVNNTTMIALKGSLLKQNEEDELLAWTSMALLQTQCNPNKKMLNILSKFGVLCSPPVELVVENLKNVCSTPCDLSLLNLRSKVLQTTYTMLQEQSHFDATSLADVPFILVEGKALAEPARVVFNLPYENTFRPYLYKLPSLLARYSELFQKVGVEAEPTVVHYAKVLSTIHEETLYKTTLHSNLIRTVSEATKQLFILLKEHKNKDLQKLKSLYLPTTDGKLHDSSSLVLNNCSINLEELTDIFKCCSLKCVHPGIDKYEEERLIKLLPLEIRPRLLSQITEQIIDVDSVTFCTYGENCEFKTCLQDLLVSSEFHEGLVCVLRSQSNGELSEEDASKKCNIVLEKLEITCCNVLQTIFKYEDKLLKGTNRWKEVFVTKGSDNQCQIYLTHRDTMFHTHSVNICCTFANEINKILENIFTSRSIIILMKMLSCKDPEEIINVLKESGIWKKDKRSHHAFSLPGPGQPIPTEWYDSLDMSILNNFRVNDYVGYMDPSQEDVYVYAIIVEELDFNICGNCEIQMYRIKLGQDKFADVSKLDLYQFKRIVGQKCTALVLVENLNQQEKISENWYNKALEDIKKEIDSCLTKIWEFPKEERKKAIRRLYLKYHPDKNIGQEELSTEICKFIQKRIAELEKGGKLSSQSTSSNHSNPFRGFSEFWGTWDREASHHRKNREHFSRKTNCEYNFWGFHSRRQTPPNPQEAKRWYRQAQCDLRAAEHDVGHYHTEWVFYKVHQAVEKALVAAQYFNQGKFDKSCSIRYLACKVSSYCTSLHSIHDLVLQMEEHGVDKLKTQYPNYHTSPGIPNDSIPSDKEQEVIVLAKDVLKKIKAYVYT
ncbi:sacsin-like [Rhinophrynus dorsalis]